MESSAVAAGQLLALISAGVLLAGCKSDRNADFFLPQSYNRQAPARTGSLAEIKAKQTAKRPPARLEPILMLVGYDAQGKVTALEVRRSSGDSSLDARAQKLVLERYRFPANKPDTLLLTIDPKSVPKK